MNGIEATRTLRQHGHQLPIVALTANVMKKHRDAFHEAGCSDFLSKPINRSELFSVLKQHLGNRPQKTEPRVCPTDAVDPIIDDELTKVFIATSSERNEKLKVAYTTKDWEQVRELAHAIKGSAASFGHPKLSAIAEQVQLSLDQGQTDDITTLMMDLLLELGKVQP